MTIKVSMKVNGKPVSAEVEARTLLVTYIRENLRLTGTHVGCDTAQCGACTVLMNALDFAKSHPNPTEQEVRESLEGNLCRCTGYHNIVKSIMAGAKAMGGKS